MRSPGRSLVIAALVVLATMSTGLVDGAASAAPPVTVRLTPAKGSTSVARGMPFAVRTTARNPGSEVETVKVVLTVGPSGGASTVDFAAWDVTVPAGGSARTVESVTTGHWFADEGSFSVTASIGGQPAGPPLAFDVGAPTAVPPLFEDVTAASGIHTTIGGPICVRYGSGAAWGDVDGDGDLDLYVPRHDRPAQLWINDGFGHFADEAAARGVLDEGSIGVGASFADVDDDADPDLYVVNDGPNRLYRNDGAGHFTDITAAAGVGDAGSGPSAAWGDYDGDGHLDLYVANYRTCGVQAEPDVLYHNEGDGTFTDQTALLGVGTTLGAGFQAAWVDVDLDGDADLYLANDFLHEINERGNRLWRNDGSDGQGGWRFTDISADSGTGFLMNSMGIGVSDYDGDQDLDLAISNVGPTALARNNGDGTFTDVAPAARVDRPSQDARNPSITWGLAFADLNLDGWEDLYVASGPLVTPSAPLPNEVLVNDGTGKFLDLSAGSGADDPGTSRGVAFADYDRDGRMDLFVVNEAGESRLYRNVTPTTGHWLEVDTVGAADTRDGCGALVHVTVGGGTMLREVLCGSTSLASWSDPTVHLGLGDATVADEVVIDWPSGLQQVLTDVPADQVLTVVEPGS
jgi:hypothetical protein